jgi:hypothetical protein
MQAIIRKLDSDFFAGRWDSVTNRQRELLFCIAHLDNADNEFTISEIVEVSKKMLKAKPFAPADVSQMLPRLIDKGLIYKNRTGKYFFAVPLFSSFMKRRYATPHLSQRTLF